MNTSNKRTYQTPTCLCADIDNEAVLCQTSQFHTEDVPEMDEDDYAGVKGYRIFDNAFPD